MVKQSIKKKHFFTNAIENDVIEIRLELFIPWQNLQNVTRQKLKIIDEKKNCYSIL